MRVTKDRPVNRLSATVCPRPGTLVLWAVALFTQVMQAGEPVAVAGRWSLERNAEKPRYLFRDGDREIDLFSYHQSDSNGDGIDEVRLQHDTGAIVMESQGWPNHPTATFPNTGNPNTIRAQDFTFRLPLVPRRAAEITRLPMGPIGVALNGVVFFNPFEQGGMNAVEGYSEVWLDSCCGHPQQTGVYHYHKYPTCVKSPFADDGTAHSPVIGFAFDGFPIHGPYESSGVMAMDLEGDQSLDVCNGHEDTSRGYHYHVTPGRFPYVIGGYRGVPEPSNNRGLRRMASGAIEDNAAGESRLEQVIAAVRPGTIQRGGRREVVLVLDPKAASRGGIPSGKPSWVQFGPYEAVAIDRKGDTVTATLDVPADASVGMLLDCHVEFDAGGRTRVFKKNDVLRVSE
jgi:hypothetical protein